MSGRILIDKKYHDLIREGFNKGDKPSEIFKRLRIIHGRTAPSHKTVLRYYRIANREKTCNSSINISSARTSAAARTSASAKLVVTTESQDDIKNDDNEIICIKQEPGNRKPERILSDFVQNEQRYFVVKWKPQSENTSGEMII